MDIPTMFGDQYVKSSLNSIFAINLKEYSMKMILTIDVNSPIMFGSCHLESFGFFKGFGQF